MKTETEVSRTSNSNKAPPSSSLSTGNLFYRLLQRCRFPIVIRLVHNKTATGIECGSAAEAGSHYRSSSLIRTAVDCRKREGAVLPASF